MAAGRVEPGTNIVFYDGVCGFCNATVRFIAARDKRKYFRFASQQSALAAEVLTRWQRNAADLDTMFVLVDYALPSEKLHSNADAILTMLGGLGGLWSASRVARLLPLAWLDRAYAIIIRNRYRIFGKFDQCPLPPPQLRQRFVTEDEAPPPAESGAL